MNARLDAMHPDARRRAVALGSRLRAARHFCGWSLAEVERASGGRYKAAAVAAYERGDRGITAVRLIELAEFYEVPVAVIAAETPDALAVPKLLAEAYALLAQALRVTG